MKKNILSGKYIMLLLLFSAFAFVSCKKDKSEDEKEPTKKELLSNKWKVSDIQDAAGNSYINVPIDQIGCLKDNVFTFQANNTYIIDKICDPITASSGTWALIENESKIEFTQAGSDPLVVTLVDVNTTTLKISYELTDIPLPGTYTIILQKQ